MNNRCDEFVTPNGSKEKIIYSSKVYDDGTIELIETGKENFYEYIQSFKDSVDIGVILKKAIAGDLSGLQKVQGFYADATQFPKTKAEILQAVIDAQKNFDTLPLEIREQFDNDFNKFFVTMDSPEWIKKMQMSIKNDNGEVKEIEQEQ